MESISNGSSWMDSIHGDLWISSVFHVFASAETILVSGQYLLRNAGNLECSRI